MVSTLVLNGPSLRSGFPGAMAAQDGRSISKRRLPFVDELGVDGVPSLRA